MNGQADWVRQGCIYLDPEWPGSDGRPRGPRLCETYPNCECGKLDADRAAKRVAQRGEDQTTTNNKEPTPE